MFSFLLYVERGGTERLRCLACMEDNRGDLEAMQMSGAEELKERRKSFLLTGSGLHATHQLYLAYTLSRLMNVEWLDTYMVLVPFMYDHIR